MLVMLAALGAAIGVVFPKYAASALLQFPEASNDKEKWDKDKWDKDKAVDLATFKRIAASYGSSEQLSAFIHAKGLQRSSAAAQLVLQSKQPRFWEKTAAPVLPFSKRDQRELGDLKDAAVPALVGLELNTDAATPSLAAEMIAILSDYYVNAVMRERVRSWVLSGQADSIGVAKGIEAAIVRAELDVALLERRAKDMKGILAKYPSAERMDTRQVISLSPTDESQRFLSPLAQLVGFESAISQRGEQIRRWQRELKQKQLLGSFFVDALPMVESEIDIEKLLPSLKKLAATRLGTADTTQEWVREASLRVLGHLDGFDIARNQFGLRNNSVRVTEVDMRTPSRLSLLFAALGAVGLTGIALVRATLRAEDA